jgi:hypothetical protein
VLIGEATARILEPTELKQLLAGCLLIDGAAARVLAERGYADLIGATVTEGPAPDFDAEQVLSAAGFEDMAGQTLYSMAHFQWGTEYDTIYVAVPLPETEIVTAFVYQGQPGLGESYKPVMKRHGLMRCINRLGGRIVLSPTAFTTQSSNFFGYQKRELLRRMIDWLSPEALPAAVLEAPNVSLTVNRSNDGASLTLTVIALGIDPIPSLKLAMAPSLTGWRVESLEDDSWHPVSHTWTGNTLEIALTLTVLEPRILRLKPSFPTAES